VAERIPLADASVDASVVRLALHHFERPAVVLSEVRRILRPGGRLAVLDILTDPDPATARLHNSIERLRDPSHTSFYAPDALVADLAAAGFRVADPELWETPRSFEDWARIIADEVRMAALEDVLRELARAGISAGIHLREQDGELFFTYRWGLFVADA
jgi:SAM-dependent methyltransferase